MNFVADWRETTDMAAMRRKRQVRAQAEMAKRDIDALLVFRAENVRYVGSLRPTWMPTFLYIQAAVITTDSEAPIVWAMHDDYPHRSRVMTWLPTGHVRPLPGAIEGSSDAGPTLVALREGLSDLGFTSGRLGVDIVSVNVLEQLQKLMPGTEIVDGEWCMRAARVIKTAEEIDLMRNGCRAVDAAFEVARGAIRPGVRETEILADAYRELFRMGAEMPQSAGIVASGPHSSPMARMATDRIMQNGDIVWIDVGGAFNGIFCEASRAFTVGSPSKRQIEIHTAVHATQQALFAALRPGVTANELQEVARRQLDPAGLTQYLQGGPLLHGIGVGAAEPHWIPGPAHPYELTLEEGMTFSSVPTLQVPDVAGGGGVRLEDQLVITNDGVEVFTRSAYDERLLPA